MIEEHYRCGPALTPRDWRNVPPLEWTRAERVMGFVERYLIVPEGTLVGRKMRLLPFQEQFLYGIYDNPEITRNAYLSIARKNGKTGLIAALLLAHIVGPEAIKNSQIVSGAMSRDQAALVYNLAAKMIQLSDELSPLCRLIPSYKRIIGRAANVEYKALSADAQTAHGLSPAVAILDEVGQITGPSSKFVDAIETSQGAYEHPLLIAISTQAPSDADLLSIWLDSAERDKPEKTVSMVFEADEDCDLLDREQWRKANPAMGVFRSEADLADFCGRATRIPAEEARTRNLYLNLRVAQESLWLAPAVWKKNEATPDPDVFRVSSPDRGGPVALGLDLSGRQDLTAAVLAAMDIDGYVHLLPYVFTPLEGLRDRARRDRTPYDIWVEKGHLIAIPGKSLDYDAVVEYLRDRFDDEDFVVDTVEFDRWRINDFKRSCEKIGFGPYSEDDWHPVGQGYRDFSPRCEAFLDLLLKERIRHGNHPLLTMSASNAIAVYDSAMGTKIDKSKSTQRIDPLVAAVMATYPITEGLGYEESTYDDEGAGLLVL